MERAATPEEATILIVDDNPANLGVLTHVLQTYGFRVLAAQKGETGIQTAQRVRPDLILLDVVLPGIDGFETCRRLKANALTQDIPVLFMTMLSEPVDKVTGFQVGGGDYITKPFQEEEVLARVTTQLRIRRLTRHLQEHNEQLHAAQAALRTANADLEQRVAERTAALVKANADLQEQIAERQRAEATLAEERNLLRTLIDNLPDEIYIKDAQSRFLNANATVAQIHGLSTPEELIGKMDFDLQPYEEAVADYRAEQAILQSGQPMINRETANRDKTRWRLETKIPLRDGQGLIVGLVGINRFITERKQAEAALAAERNLLRTLIDNLPDYIYVKDRESQFVSGNIAVARLMGTASPEELVGQTDFDFYPPELARQYYADEQALMQSGQPLIDREEPVIDQATGQKRWLSSTKVPLRDGQRQIVGLVGMSRDITGRRSLEAQLRQSQKLEAIGRLAGGIAHDFNNLLTAILGYTHLALAGLDTTTQLYQDILAIQAVGERAASLTQQLLAFSRQQVLQPELLYLNTVVAQLGQLLRRLIGEDIELVMRLEERLDWVKADPGQLAQVLINLAVNARDAMPQGGQLTMHTANVALDAAYARQVAGVRPGAYVMCAISDTGHGMDAETQARIFEPFFTTKEPGKGTGLGLATVHGIVNQSGGHICVSSNVGQGSTFKIYLPRAEVSDAPAAPQPSAAPVPHGSETILLVEDDSNVRLLVQAILCKHGYIVLEAPNGVEALRVSQTSASAIDLVISDVIMPGGLNGPQVVEQLLGQRPSLKVLYISGYSDNVIVHQGVLKAGLAFLQKPFAPRTLALKVREVLDSTDD